MDVVAAGLVNSTIDTVINVIYHNAHIGASLACKNPPQYCDVVSFTGF